MCERQLCQVSVELESAINSGNIQIGDMELRPLTWCHCGLQSYSRIGRNYSCGSQGVSDHDPNNQWFSFLLNVFEVIFYFYLRDNNHIYNFLKWRIEW